MNFTEYAKSKGITLNRDDLSFLHERLEQNTTDERTYIAKKFIDIWHNTMTQCNNSVKKQNEGRKAANIWLRTLKQ